MGFKSKYYQYYQIMRHIRLFAFVLILLLSQKEICAQNETIVQDSKDSVTSLQHSPRMRGQQLSQKIDTIRVGLDSVKTGLNTIVNHIDETTQSIKNNTSFDAKARVAWWVAIFALIVSAISMYYAIITYNAQKKTEENTKKAEENTKKAEQNTKRVSLDAQRGLLSELLRHLYRNYVITYAMRSKVVDIDYDGYPSEEHFEKLKIPMENIHLDVFYGEDKDKLQLMHVLYLNLRNYNMEVDVARKHICNPDLSRETKELDFDTLEFKVSYLTGKIFDTIMDIWGSDQRYKEEMREAIKLSLSGKTNAKNNIEVLFDDEFTPLSIDYLKDTAYNKLYSYEELTEFCRVFNKDVREERGQNQRGAWKIRIIRF